ncbi:MAG: sugar phosphate isomerase/epimerase [Clostridia bacterium]|nr:sugar phosphate isomerase/epimerase [Clostridia bacterium]
MNKIGIFVNFWENTWKVDLKKYIAKAARIGYDVLEFQAQALLDMSDGELAELKACADANGIELTYSLGLDPAYDISSPDDTVREGGIKYLSAIMTQIGKMEGKLLSGVSYAGWGVPTEGSKTVRFYHSVSSMRKLAEIAKELGLTYGIEAVNRFEGILVNTAKEARAYVAAVNSKSVGILLDTYHMNIEESSIGDAIRTAGDLLVGFHIGENNRTCPGRGHLDWNEIFGALRDVNYKGRIVAEPFLMTGGEVGRSISVWRNLIDDPSEAALDAEATYMLDYVKKHV